MPNTLQDIFEITFPEQEIKDPEQFEHERLEIYGSTEPDSSKRTDSLQTLLGKTMLSDSNLSMADEAMDEITTPPDHERALAAAKRWEEIEKMVLNQSDKPEHRDPNSLIGVSGYKVLFDQSGTPLDVMKVDVLRRDEVATRAGERIVANTPSGPKQNDLSGKGINFGKPGKLA